MTRKERLPWKKGNPEFDAAVEVLVQKAVEQGFPRKIEDPETCRKIAILLRDWGAAA